MKSAFVTLKKNGKLTAKKQSILDGFERFANDANTGGCDYQTEGRWVIEEWMTKDEVDKILANVSADINLKIARFCTSYSQALMELKGFPEEDLLEIEVLERAAQIVKERDEYDKQEKD